MDARNRLREVLRDEGVRGLWWRGLGVTAYRRLILAAQAQDGVPPMHDARVEVSAAWLSADTVEAYVAMRPDTPRAEVERRLAAGQRCVITMHEARMASVLWFALDRAEVPYLDLVYELAPGVAYVYDVFTSPQARRLGTAKVARQFYEPQLRETGVHTLLGTAMPENAAGRGLVRHAGYTEVGTIGCLRLARLRVPVTRLDRDDLVANPRRMAR